MDNHETKDACKGCGKPLGKSGFSWLCPACFFAEISGTLLATPPEAVTSLLLPLPEDLHLIFPELEIRRLVGRGGMGAVYEGYQEDLERRVALKILPPESAQDLEFRERFRQEASTLAQLDHPNIVRLFDFGERQGYFYMIMEFVDGETLATRMTRESIQTEELTSLLEQLCAALAYSHGHGVVHRDIKPANILLEETGMVRVVDFGLAKATRHPQHDWGLTRTQVSIGTPQYMAPEQFEQNAVIDHRADIYSVGVILYEILTGKLPTGHFAKPSQSKRRCPKRFDQIVRKALQQDPDERYQDVTELALALRKKRNLLPSVVLFVIALSALAFVLVNRSKGPPKTVGQAPERILEVQYDAGLAGRVDPVDQGWKPDEIKLGAGGNARATSSDTGEAWRIDDCLIDESHDLPTYRYIINDPKETARRLFQNGWEFSFTYRIEKQAGSSDYAAFCGLRISSKAAPPEWEITEGKSARIGFYLGRTYDGFLFRRKYLGDFIARNLDPAPQLGHKSRTNAFTKTSSEPGAWHTVRVVGEAQSPGFDWYLDGEYAGSGRVSDEEMSDVADPIHVIFYSGSPGEVERVTDWRKITLHSGIRNQSSPVLRQE